MSSTMPAHQLSPECSFLVRPSFSFHQAAFWDYKLILPLWTLCTCFVWVLCLSSGCWFVYRNCESRFQVGLMIIPSLFCSLILLPLWLPSCSGSCRGPGGLGEWPRNINHKKEDHQPSTYIELLCRRDTRVRSFSLQFWASTDDTNMLHCNTVISFGILYL